jgi:hypothetical protein
MRRIVVVAERTLRLRGRFSDHRHSNLDGCDLSTAGHTLAAQTEPRQCASGKNEQADQDEAGHALS